MRIETQNYGEVTVVELQGDFSGESDQAFHDTITSVIAAGAKAVVLDMSAVIFIDSQSLEQLLWMRDYCNENSRQLKLAALDETCAKILEITRLAPQFDSYEELAEAVKSFV